MSPRRLIPEDGWSRVGPGRGLEFESTTPAGAVQQVLLDYLPQEFAPYQLVTIRFLEQRRVWEATEHALPEFEALCARGETAFFIRSMKISPVINWQETNNPQGLCSLNGMIHLRHHDQFGRGVFLSDIGIVWKVGHLTTYEVVEHVDYLKIFETLRRALKKHFPLLHGPALQFGQPPGKTRRRKR